MEYDKYFLRQPIDKFEKCFENMHVTLQIIPNKIPFCDQRKKQTLQNRLMWKFVMMIMMVIMKVAVNVHGRNPIWALFWLQYFADINMKRDFSFIFLSSLLFFAQTQKNSSKSSHNKNNIKICISIHYWLFILFLFCVTRNWHKIFNIFLY